MSKCQHSNRGYVCNELGYLRDIAALEARCRVLDDALKIAGKIRSKDDANRIADLEVALREVLADRIDAEWSMGTDWTEKVDKLLASTSETPAEPRVKLYMNCLRHTAQQATMNIAGSTGVMPVVICPVCERESKANRGVK